jgi:hypothetical protein
MTAAVVGYGMVSPGGLTPRDHAFFVFSGVLTPPPSPFVTADDRAVDVWYCPWLGASMPVHERLVALAEAALRDALAPLQGDLQGASAALVLCAGPPRPGLSKEDITRLSEALVARAGCSLALSSAGDAGVFAALSRCMELLDKGSARVAVIVAVDSFISLEAAEERVRFPPSYWSVEAPAPSEAAAAVALMAPDAARRGGLEILGTIRRCASMLGASNDENDAPVDGAAMAAALRSLPSDEAVGFVFGQDRVDSLRKMEWHLASARNAGRFDRACAMWTPEAEIGRVGAAAGLVNLVQGLAMLRHRTALREAAPASRTACAWAISPDGTRGLAFFTEGRS